MNTKHIIMSICNLIRLPASEPHKSNSESAMKLPSIIASIMLVLSQSSHAQSVVWSATGPGAGDADAPGTYYATNGVNYYDLTWTGSGQAAADVTSSPIFNNTFSMYQATDAPSSSVLFSFNSGLQDADGLVDGLFNFQRGDYGITLLGGAIWTSANVSSDLTGNGGYTVTGVGSNALTLTRTDNADVNAYSIDFQFGVSGSFIGLQYNWSPDGFATNGSTGISNDLLGLRFGTLEAVPVPEPSGALLLTITGVLGILRRRR
jgi:hypothetical protein